MISQWLSIRRSRTKTSNSYSDKRLEPQKRSPAGKDLEPTLRDEGKRGLVTSEVLKCSMAAPGRSFPCHGTVQVDPLKKLPAVGFRQIL